MSWLYSQALVEEYLGASCSDGEPSVQSNGNPIPQAFCVPDRMTKFSRLSRFGMTFAPLTDARGKELLTLYLAGFPARTSVPQDTVQASPAVDQDSGLKWQGLLGKYDHATRSWKTAQCSLLADLEQCLETWPQWGLMRDGECWEQQTLEQTIRGIGFGLLPTPVKSDYKGTSKNSKFQSRLIQYKAWDNGTEASTLYPNPLAYEVLMGWPLRWTDLKPLEMGKSHFVQQQHSNF